MKIAIVGSRNFKDKEFVKTTTYFYLRDFLDDDIEFISGGAKGVDSWTETVVDELNIPKHIFKPYWNKYGKKAGFLRNKQIVDEADMLIAFWDGKSKGTSYSIDLAKKKGIPVDVYIRN